MTRSARDRNGRTRLLAIDVVSVQKRLRINRAEIRRAVDYVLAAEKVNRAHIEVALVDDEAIRRTHRQYFGLDSSTDVITFPLNESGEPLHGHIVVSAETALREARRRRITPNQEVLLYVVHGVLHLCGYDDRGTTAAKKMQRRQRELLRALHGASRTISPAP